MIKLKSKNQSKPKVLLAKKETTKSKDFVVSEKKVNSSSQLVKLDPAQVNQLEPDQSSFKVVKKPTNNATAISNNNLVIPLTTYKDLGLPKPPIPALNPEVFLQNGYEFIKLFIYTMFKRLKNAGFSSKHYYYLNWIIFHFLSLETNRDLLPSISYTAEMIADSILKFEENVKNTENKINQSGSSENIKWFSKPLRYLEAHKDLDQRLDSSCMDLYKNLFFKKTIQRQVKGFSQLYYSDFIWCFYTLSPIEWFNKEPIHHEWFKNNDTTKKDSTYLLFFMNGASLEIIHWQFFITSSPTFWKSVKITSKDLIKSLNPAIKHLSSLPVIVYANYYDYKDRSSMPLPYEFYDELFSLGVFPSSTQHVWGPMITGHRLIKIFNQKFKKILLEFAQKETYNLDEFYLQNIQVKEKLIQDSLDKYHKTNHKEYALKDDLVSVLAYRSNAYRLYLRDLYTRETCLVETLLDNFEIVWQETLSENRLSKNLKERIKPIENVDFSNPKQVKNFFINRQNQLQTTLINHNQQMTADLLNLLIYKEAEKLMQTKFQIGKLKPIKPPKLGQLQLSRQVSFLNIFQQALELSARPEKKEVQEINVKKQFIAARNRLALFLLFFTGIHVGSLLRISLGQLDQFFSNNKEIQDPVNFSLNPPKPNFLVVDARVKKEYLFRGFNLYEDYQILLECMDHYAHKEKLSHPEKMNLCFFGQYNHFGKTCSRPNTNKIINDLLRKAAKLSFPKNTPSKLVQSYTSYSFRVHVSKYLLRTMGISKAQQFMNRVSFVTTVFYDQDLLSQEIFQEISKGLATEEKDWPPKKVALPDQAIDRLCHYIAQGIPVERFFKENKDSFIDDETYNKFILDSSKFHTPNQIDDVTTT